jgi:penicillin-binding protein 1A
MSTAYGVFATGGYRVNPMLITRVADARGKVLHEEHPKPFSDDMRAIEPRNAFMIESLLYTVAHSGTAARAGSTLKRADVYGKTGTTNDSMDAWFCGFQPSLAAVVWIGYDTPRKLGDHETGGGLALPIWVSYMDTAIKGVPVAEVPAPPGVVNVGGEWYFDDYQPGRGVASLGVDTSAAPPAEEISGAPISSTPPPEERSKILDLFRN